MRASLRLLSTLLLVSSCSSTATPHPERGAGDGPAADQPLSEGGASERTGTEREGGPPGDAGKPDACVGCWQLPADRVVDWDPGHRGPIPDVPVQVNVKDHGAAGDGVKDDAPAFKAALAAVKGQGAVLVPAGTYLLKAQLSLATGVVLRGEGAAKSKLVIDVNGNGGIDVSGSYGPGPIAITAGSTAGSTQLTLASTTGLAAGQLVWIYSDNDGAVMYTSSEWNQTWAEHSVGQTLELKSVSGNTVTLDRPLRLTHPAARKPELRVLLPVRDFGIEDLGIKRIDQSEDNIISINRALNGWVRRCDLAWCTRAHIQVSQARHLTFFDNTLHEAYNYGGGGHGYGFQVGQAACDSLFENNTFHTLRHSMLIQLGANGNVFAYNHSRLRKLTDISIHGHYSYMNLFEGNQVEEAVYADYWGPIGPLTTLYRNRVTVAPIAIRDHSVRPTVVGNTVVNTGGVTVDSTIVQPLVLHNRVAGKVTGTLPPLPASLWRASKPSYWGSRPWPCTGADVDAGASTGWCQLPAAP